MNAAEMFKKKQGRTPVAVLATSTAIPHLSNTGYHEYYTDIDSWINAHRRVMLRFPDLVWVPGPVYETGLNSVALAYGAKCRFSNSRTPEYEAIPLRLDDLVEAKIANPLEQGLMPLILAFQRKIEQKLSPEGLNRGFAYSWGPLSITQTLLGMTELMLATVDAPGPLMKVLDTMTETSIRWIHAQLDVMKDPSGIFIGDDITGLVSEETCRTFVIPQLQKISDEFSGLVRIYHNDTVCPHLMELIPESGFDIWHFSHEIEIAEFIEKTAGRIIPMGNIAPLSVGMHGTPKDVKDAVQKCFSSAGNQDMILSWGGSMAGETPFENIDTLVQASAERTCASG